MTRVIRILSTCGIVIGLTACGGDDSPPPMSGGSGAAGSAGSPSITGGMGGASGKGGLGGAAPLAGGFGGSSPETGGMGGGPAAGGAGGGSDRTCFSSVTDYASPGTFTPTSGDVTSVMCTLFRPTVLGDGGCKHPVI